MRNRVLGLVVVVLAALAAVVSRSSVLPVPKPHDQIDYVISYPAMAGRTMVASAAPAPPGSLGVNIGAFTFGPPGVTITPGKTVTWTNTDESPHQITVAGTPLKTGFLLKGQNASLTFKDEGVFNYSCALHPSMKGTVQVSK